MSEAHNTGLNPLPEGFVAGRNGGMLRAPWKAGQPNPGGSHIKSQFRQCQEICREYSPESARAIIKMAETTEDERIAYMCNTWVYERAWGKPKEFDPKELADNIAKLDFSRLSPEHRKLILEMCRVAIVAPQQQNDATGDAQITIDASPEVQQQRNEQNAEAK